MSEHVKDALVLLESATEKYNAATVLTRKETNHYEGKRL